MSLGFTPISGAPIGDQGNTSDVSVIISGISAANTVGSLSNSSVANLTHTSSNSSVSSVIALSAFPLSYISSTSLVTSITQSISIVVPPVLVLTETIYEVGDGIDEISINDGGELGGPGTLITSSIPSNITQVAASTSLSNIAGQGSEILANSSSTSAGTVGWYISYPITGVSSSTLTGILVESGANRTTGVSVAITESTANSTPVTISIGISGVTILTKVVWTQPLKVLANVSTSSSLGVIHGVGSTTSPGHICTVGSSFSGICYNHPSATAFTGNWTTSGSTTTINGLGVIRIGDQAPTSCGHTAQASVGSAYSKSGGIALHRSGDAITIIQTAGGSGTSLEGSTAVISPG